MLTEQNMLKVYVKFNRYGLEKSIHKRELTTYHVRAGTWIDALSKVLPLIKLPELCYSVMIEAEMPLSSTTDKNVYITE